MVLEPQMGRTVTKDEVLKECEDLSLRGHLYSRRGALCQDLRSCDPRLPRSWHVLPPENGVHDLCSCRIPYT